MGNDVVNAGRRLFCAASLLALTLLACTTDRVPDSHDPVRVIQHVRTLSRLDIQEGKLAQFDLEMVAALRASIATETQPDSRRALSYLHGFVNRRFAEQGARELQPKITTLQSSPISLDNDTLSLADVGDHLAREPDPNRRRRIAESLCAALAALEPLLEQRARQITDRSKELDLSDRLTLASVVRGYDARDAARIARDFLNESDALYYEALRELAVTDGTVPLTQLRRPDIPWLFRAVAPLQTDRVLAAAHATALLLGARLLPLDQVVPMLEPRHPWDVPRSAAEDALHAIGHSLHQFGSRVPTFELRYLGDRSVAEAFAVLFEGLATEPTWLRQQLRMEEPHLTEHLHRTTLSRLLTARLHAAHVIYEVDRQGQSATKSPEAYAAIMSRAMGVPFDPIDAQHDLNEQDPFLDCADSLRGHIVAAQIHAELVKRFGDSWWQLPAAGEFLAELWLTGQRDTAEELVARLVSGAVERSSPPSLEPEALMRWTATGLIRDVPVATLPL